ncbi:MAG TPA: response regulator [Candidatus Thermoplasmatota archaeon]|nr:response regulator [Candidatus Thermoplasmatota archaeon]
MTRTILLADDNDDHRFLTRRALAPLCAEAGAELLLARDGQEALDVLRARSVDLLLLDIKMPRLTGFEVLAALRDERIEPRPRVVMLSSSEHAQDVDQALALGADDYVTKSMDPRAFRDAVVAAARRHLR